MNKVLITCYPFCEISDEPIKFLIKKKTKFFIKNFQKDFKKTFNFLKTNKINYYIAGTEKIHPKVYSLPDLKIISRVGTGLDNVDLLKAKKNKIKVYNTPDAMTDSVSELCVAFILSLVRKINISSNLLKKKKWNRVLSKNLDDLTVGIVGYGRIGKSLSKKLSSLSRCKILINDIRNIKLKNKNFKVVSKDYILKNSDILSINVPLTKKTKNLLNYSSMKKMKKDSILINTARGGIINENDLEKIIKKHDYFSGVAIDVFENEPYIGNLTKIDKIVCTPHTAAMTVRARTKMEFEAVQNIFKNYNDK